MNLSSSYSDLKSKKAEFKKFKETMKENKIHPDRKEKEKTSGSVEIKSLKACWEAFKSIREDWRNLNLSKLLLFKTRYIENWQNYSENMGRNLKYTHKEVHKKHIESIER